jgi:hypothetical protein
MILLTYRHQSVSAEGGYEGTMVFNDRVYRYVNTTKNLNKHRAAYKKLRAEGYSVADAAEQTQSLVPVV